MGANVLWAYADGTTSVTETVHIGSSNIVATACLSDFTVNQIGSAAAATIWYYTPGHAPPDQPLQTPVAVGTAVTSVTFGLSVAHTGVVNAAFTVIEL